MDATIESIVNASKLPMSIVIVGVGSADFGKMHHLDSDNRLLRIGNKVAQADIVQFVPFREFKDKHYSELAASTLAEIPSQLVSYFKRNGIIPNPPVLLFIFLTCSLSDIAIPVHLIMFNSNKAFAVSNFMVDI